MIGTTLGDIRSHVEGLASEDGRYVLVCARSGDRPVPASDLRFDSRARARSAAVATEQYRAALRRYDPQVPCYDVIACQQIDGSGRGADSARSDDTLANPNDGIVDSAGDDGNASCQRTTDPAGRSGSGWTGSTSGRPTAGADANRSVLVECCHRVAAAVFEALSDAGYDDVESAVMDAYFDLAEDVADPDELCLCLLECTATAIDRQLTPHQQAMVLNGAVARLPVPEATDRPISATLRRLREQGLIGGHARSPWSVDRDGASRSVVLLVSEYALSPQAGRLPVLPLAVELFRDQPQWQPAALSVVDVDPGWMLELTLDWDAPPSGLASAPIHRLV